MQRIARDPAADAGRQKDYSAQIALIHRHFPPSVATLYAVPRLGDDGVLQWWTSLPGKPLLFAELDAQQQQQLLARYHERQGRVGDLADELSRQGSGADAAAVRTLIGTPDLNSLYSVNGEPVVTRWVKAEPPPAVLPVVPPPVPPDAGRWWRSWPALLLAALLLLLLLWWLFTWIGWRWGKADEPALVPLPVPAETLPAQIDVPEEPVPPPPPSAPEPVPEPSLPPEPPAKPVVLPKPVAANRMAYACRAKLPDAQAPEFVTVFDTSGSMNLSIKATRADETWFFKYADDPQMVRLPGALERLKRVLEGPTRLDVAQRAFAEMVGTLHPDIRTGLVTYGSCRKPVQQGFFSNAQRQQLINHVKGLEADGGTPLAASLLEAAGMVDGKTRDAVIVAFVDGEDGCDQNQCRAAEQIAREKPRLQINVVDITGSGLSNCVAKATGGRVFNPKNTDEVGRMLKAASADLASDADCR